MSSTEKAYALGGNNRGAVLVCMNLGDIDCRYLTILDELGITGPEIYKLYADVCGESLPKTGYMLIAYDEGVMDLSRDRLVHAINNRGAGVNVENITNTVLLRRR